jgi:hypothetical protein
METQHYNCKVILESFEDQMESQESSTILELYDQYLAEKDASNQSGANGRLISALYSTDLSVGDGNGNAARQVMKIIQEVRPISAGASHFTEYVATYVKHARKFPHLFRNIKDVSRVTLVLETILSQNKSISDIEALIQQCNSLSTVEDCLHTTFIGFIFFVDVNGTTDKDRSCVRVTSCEILASIQTANGKLFAKYLRCFLFWYFEDELVNSKSKALINSYLRSSPDLLSASIYKELLSIFTEVVVECLAVKKSLITKSHCESLIKKILELVPLPVSIEIISKSFFSSKVSRIRLSAIDFLEVTIGKLHQIRCNSISNSIDTPLQLDSSRIYDEQLEEAIEDEQNITAGKTEEIVDVELESMLKRSMAFIFDAGD